MKYIIVLGDGMADEPISQLANKTPLQVAKKPYMDYLAKKGELGLTQTVPKGMAPGSDTANLSVLGYNPQEVYTGRSPLEALSLGIELSDDDITLRANLVTLSSEEEEYNQKRMLDHGAGDISTEEAHELMDALSNMFNDDIKTFYKGVGYRHILKWQGGSTNVTLIPPHDIRNQSITNHLPKGQNAELMLEIMKKSYDLLANHPVNVKRVEQGLLPANSLWLWGEGTKPGLGDFYEQYGVKGAMISAVDLLNGMAKGAGLDIISVEGATGNLHTNYVGKAMKAIEVLEDHDFVYIHIEAPDECSHAGLLDDKIKAIEYIDEKIVGTLLKELKDEDFRILLLPDHATPIRTCTHTDQPVPYALYDSRKEEAVLKDVTYDECCAADQGHYFAEGYTLMDYFIKGGRELANR